MEATLFDIAGIVLAIALLVGVAWTLGVSYQYYQIDDHPIRLSRMMHRLDVETIKTANDTRFRRDLAMAARLCRICTHQAECDAWLSCEGKAVAPPAFCPSANLLHLIALQRKLAA